MDPISAYLTTIGTILLLISWILMIFTSSKEDFAWGLSSVLFPPAAYAFALIRLDLTKDSMTMAALGSVFLLIGMG